MSVLSLCLFNSMRPAIPWPNRLQTPRPIEGGHRFYSSDDGQITFWRKLDTNDEIGWARLRREALDPPPVAVAGVAEAIVEAGRLALP